LAASILLMGLYISIAAFSPYLVPYAPSEIAGSPLEEPGKSHLLGTNDLGQDIFSSLLCGARATLALGFLGALLSVLTALIFGTTSAYYGGRTDEVISRIVDIIMTLPGFPLLIVLVVFLPPSIFIMGGIMGLLGGVQGIRLIRSQVLSLVKAEFVYGAKAMGAGDHYIMARHILPGVLPLAIVMFVNAAQRFMLMGVGLGFLGLGDPSVVDWGQMISRAYSNGGFALGLWWWLMPPGMAVVLLSMSLAMLGYSLEGEMEPRLKRPDCYAER
jgi:peptide/nickel transport system permease protein